MHPILFTIGAFRADSFVVMGALGAAAGFWVWHSRLRAEGAGSLEIQALFLGAFFLSVLISRLWHFAEDPAAFSFLGLLRPQGLRWHAFVIGGIAAMLLGERFIPAGRGRLFDAAAMAVAPGQAIGRIGCLLVADSCNGISCDLPWAVTLKTAAMAAPARVHPTPVYESINLLLITGVLAVLTRKRAKPWVVTAAYLALSGLQRFVVQFWRTDPRVFGPLTNYHYAALLSLLIGTAALIRLSRHGLFEVP